MYATIAPPRPAAVEPSLPEQEQLYVLDAFLTAVSGGWDQVMAFLECCPLTFEARHVLEELRLDA